jgi:hypothetical protein
LKSCFFEAQNLGGDYVVLLICWVRFLAAESNVTCKYDSNFNSESYHDSDFQNFGMCPFSNLVIGAVLDNIIFFVQFLCEGLEVLSLCKSHLCLAHTPQESGEILGVGEILAFQFWE